MLCRARAAGVERVEVHLQRVGNVARHHGALQEMQVVEHVDDPRRIVQVLHRAFAVIAARRIDHVHGSAGGAVVHAAARQVEVVMRLATVQRDIPRSPGQHVLHQRRREAQATIFALQGTRGHHRLHTALRRA